MATFITNNQKVGTQVNVGSSGDIEIEMDFMGLDRRDGDCEYYKYGDYSCSSIKISKHLIRGQPPGSIKVIVEFK